MRASQAMDHAPQEGRVNLSRQWIVYILAALLIIVYLVLTSEEAFRHGIGWTW